MKALPLDEVARFPPDQQRGVPVPPMQKPPAADATLIQLTPPDQFNLGQAPLIDIINQRRSRRKFTADPLTLDELAFLLWATQGVQKVFGDGVASFRTAPSAGARHALETYIVVSRVGDLEPGLYRYLPVDHALCLEFADSELAAKMADACMRQGFVATAAATFIWAAIPYRMEWRYTVRSSKAILLDAGHVCQNLYLASEAIGAGTCAIAAYFQDQVDALLRVDGHDEFAIYVAPVGKIG